jgi:hypothetical protein
MKRRIVRYAEVRVRGIGGAAYRAYLELECGHKKRCAASKAPIHFTNCVACDVQLDSEAARPAHSEGAPT